MSQQHSLFSFVSDALIASGAVLEPSDSVLQCLLPTALAQTLVTEEEITLLRPSTEHPFGHILNYEHPILEHLFDHIQQEGRLAYIELTDIISRSGGLQNLFQQTIQLRQGIGEIERIHTSHCTYLLMHFRIEANCQEFSHRDIVSVACNEETLVLAPWLTENITSWPHKTITAPFWRQPLSTIYQRLQHALQQKIETLLDPFFQEIFQQISVQRRNLERWHRRERKQILQPLKEDPLSPVAPILFKLEEVTDVYRETLEAIPHRYPIFVNITPITILRMILPITRVDYQIRLRKNSRNISWIWNPILEQFEPLRCEQCQTERYHIVPTADLQLHCPQCT